MLDPGLDTRLKRTAGVDVLAVVLFAAHPLWVRVGMELSRKARPSTDGEAPEAGGSPDR